MHKYAIGVVGASGYSGIELCRVLAAHPGVEVRFVASDRWEGATVRARTGIGGAVGTLAYVRRAPRHCEASEGCDAVLLATPAEASLELAPALLERGVKVVDLSGAFRLADAAAYPRHYGFEHRAPGPPRRPPCTACPSWATARAIAAAPAGGQPRLLPDRGGAGPRPAAPGRAPRRGVDRHRRRLGRLGRRPPGHRGLQLLRGRRRRPAVQGAPAPAHARRSPSARPRPPAAPCALTFTPHLLPIGAASSPPPRRGSPPAPRPAALAEALRAAYRDEPLVEVLDTPEQVSLSRVVGTARAAVSVSATEVGLRPRPGGGGLLHRQSAQGRREPGGAEPEPHARAPRADRRSSPRPGSRA